MKHYTSKNFFGAQFLLQASNREDNDSSNDKALTTLTLLDVNSV